VVPAGVERGYSLVFQHLHHVVAADAERGQLIEHRLRLVVAAADAVARDLPVAGDRIERRLGHSVDHAGGDQAGHVPGALIGGVL
jgi:hypothetical protein